MIMIYTTSEGVEIDTKMMNKNHLVNAFEKNMIDRVVNGEGSEKRLKAIKNVMVLKEEILTRIKN